MHFSDAHSRRLIGGLCLILGPALILIAWSTNPSFDNDTAGWVSDVADEPARWAFGVALMAVGAAVSVIGYLALVHLLREHKPLIGDAGGALAVGGTVLLGAVVGVGLAEVEAIRHLGDSEATASMIEAIDDSAASAVLYAGTLLMTVGLLMLAYGLFMARTAPRALAALFGIGAATQAAGALAFIGPVAIAGSALVFVALGGIGAQLLRETDEAWEHAPVYEGFHTVATA